MLKSVVEHANLVICAEVGLVLFLAVFVSVTIKTLRRSKAEIHTLSHMALDPEDNPHP